MKRIILILVLLFMLFGGKAYAQDVPTPTPRPNNIFGIHILFPTELDLASRLVNSSGGDWGYVTIPIQYTDRNLEKWQKFMDDAKRDHLIPIIRIATEPYFANTSVWRKPSDYDILDFANFLNSLDWPTKTRYVLLFNEVNRYDEWGGDAPDPVEYANFVAYAADTFKSTNPNFFVIAGGLDNAAPNDGIKYVDNLAYLNRMAQANADVFKKIDGFSSHSYPNPNFAEAPSKNKQEGTSTYKYELDIVEKYAGHPMPVFITETGWNASVLPGSVIGKYFQSSMVDIWGQDGRVIAVTPFILESNGGPFDKFTFYKDGDFTAYGKAYQAVPKVKGKPEINSLQGIRLASAANSSGISESILKVKPDGEKNNDGNFSSVFLKSYFKAIFTIGK